MSAHLIGVAGHTATSLAVGSTRATQPPSWPKPRRWL